MKKILPCIVIGLLMTVSLFVTGQPLVSRYNLTVSTTASLVDMSSGTTSLIAAAIDDGASTVNSIGFDFWLMGARYTQFSANSNGFIRLGAAAISSSNYSLANANGVLISALGSDLITGDFGFCTL